TVLRGVRRCSSGCARTQRRNEGLQSVGMARCEPHVMAGAGPQFGDRGSNHSRPNNTDTHDPNIRSLPVPIGDAQPARPQQTWTLVATILGSSMTFVDATVVNVALPALQADLHATITDVQWVVEAYA